MKILGILFAVNTLMSLFLLIRKRSFDRFTAFTGWLTATLMWILTILSCVD